MPKKLRFLYYSFILAPLCFPLSLQAQNWITPGNREASVWQGNFYPSVFYFQIDDYLLMRDFRTNKIMLAALDEILTNVRLVENIDTIQIIGACSPIASEEYNRELALNRCLALRSYLRWKHLPVAERFPIQMNVIGIDYPGYDILKQHKPPLSEKEIWNRLQYAAIRLKMKDGSYIIPGSDRSKSAINHTPYSGNEAPYLKRDTVYIKDTLTVTDTPLLNTDKKPAYIALKNNLLYDLALLPNLTVEFYLGRQWSLAIEGNESWWNFGKPVQNEWVHRIQAAGLELRYWPGSPAPLQGHVLGLYALFGNYDVRFFVKNEDTNGWLSRRSWSAGISYAYSMPMTRRLNLEFGLAIGYAGGQYYQYNYCMTHQHWRQQATFDRSYFGPTRVGISLVWLIGTGSNTKDKAWNELNTYYY